MKDTGTQTAEQAPPGRSRSFGHALRLSLVSKTTGLPRRTATHEKGDCTGHAGAPGGGAGGGALEVRAARVGEQQLHRRGRRDLDHRALDDVERRLLLVGHLERLDQLSPEDVALRLLGQLALELARAR